MIKHFHIVVPVTVVLLTIGGCQRSVRLGLGLDTMYGSKDTTRQPSVRLDSSVSLPIKVLCVQLVVFSEDEIGQRLNAGYEVICNYINLHRLGANRVMAFYQTYDMPFLVEAAIEADSIPLEADSIVKSRIVAGGPVVIAHYKGPYEDMILAYRAIEKWLKDNKKIAREPPFEVYLNDLMTARSKHNLLTDVYQFYQPIAAVQLPIGKNRDQ